MPDTNVLDLLQPRAGRNYVSSYRTNPIENGARYTAFNFERPVILVPVDPVAAGTCYVYAGSEPNDDLNSTPIGAGAGISMDASGTWYLRHSGASPQIFRVFDAGSIGNLAGVLAGLNLVSGVINLAQISGTVQTPLNLTGKFAPITWSDAVSITVNAADTAVLAANPLRRGLSLANRSTLGQTIAVGITNPMVGVLGVYILGAGDKIVDTSLNCVTAQILRAYGSAAAGTLVYSEGV